MVKQPSSNAAQRKQSTVVKKSTSVAATKWTHWRATVGNLTATPTVAALSVKGGCAAKVQEETATFQIPELNVSPPKQLGKSLSNDGMSNIS